MALDKTRARRFTASMAPRLMSGNHDDIQRMFLRAIDDPRYEADEFESSWAARYGLALEPVVLDWHQEKTGEPLIERGCQYFHPKREWCSCTLDAYRERDRCIVECKCVNHFRDLDEVESYYIPQLAIQQECRQADNVALLVCRGGAEPTELHPYIEPHYRALMWETIVRFWDCVLSLTPPCELKFKRIVPPERWKHIDLDHDDNPPNWSGEMRELLSAWDTTRETAQTHERCKQHIKSLVADDVGEITCGVYRIKRDRRNALTIRAKDSK